MGKPIISHLSKWKTADWIFKYFMGEKIILNTHTHIYVYVCMNQSPNWYDAEFMPLSELPNTCQGFVI